MGAPILGKDFGMLDIIFIAGMGSLPSLRRMVVLKDHRGGWQF